MDEIDFKNLDISIIKLEFVNLSENEKMKSKTILKENGFYTFVEGIDLIGINLKKVNLTIMIIYYQMMKI